MLAAVDVPGTLTSADDIVAPFEARRIVLIDWGVIVWFEAHIVEQIENVDNLNCDF